MNRYKVQLFSSDNAIDAVDTKICDSIIQALDRFTDMCESGREDYNLDEYNVWLYDLYTERYLIYYWYSQDKYGTYEDLVPCQY